ncbi:FAD-linked oxidase [Longibacter salinarum]|uniref:FAD-linked oxidase n=1 Tax=Longibacter salinarum TaxID=1850348 RepID=A0A2A8CZ15_9BACT|nr:FAD-binding and (Fe-S)-binding domain-containing protein [Longibacter salinarum]PEN13870.1 FAD-linked oxidase [Longibacter salinarum]
MPTATPTASRRRTNALSDLIDVLASQIDGSIRSDDMTRALYATDASMYAIRPLAVLIPKTVRDVRRALRVAHEYGVPILPRGGGSSLAGQGVNEAIVIDFSKHVDAILEIDPEAKTARVQPGVTLSALNQAAAQYGLMVGPDPASGNRATLGGMLANNSTGTHSIRYGNFIQHVRRAEVLLNDGTPASMGPLTRGAWQKKMRLDGREGALYREIDALTSTYRDTIRDETPSHWRRNNGYRLETLLEDERNLAKLLAGSEGTLAVVTEMTIHLVERPARTGLGVVHFATREEALEAVTEILETDPSAVELFDGVAIERIRKTPGYAERLTFVEGEPGGVLITEYYGETEADLHDRLDALEDHLSAGPSTGLVRVTDRAGVDNVWSIRKEGLGLVMGVKGKYKPWAFIEDASVPVEHLAEYIDELSQFIDSTGTRAVYYAHASAGCLHVRPFINTKDEAEVEKMRRIAKESLNLVKRFGGCVSSEHGDGIVRGWANPEILGEELYAACCELKNIFDPSNVLNPDRVVNAPPMTDNLRMGPDYAAASIDSEFDWSAEGSYAEAIEKCNGNGACRKRGTGTMCPSFMATREEEDSTRGRANALRMALSGGLDRAELTGERMHEVMDLCIQCKACKTECPSNVDMAKIKTEWLNHYWKENRMPLRTKLFAHQPSLARWISGTPLAPIVNWTSRQGWLRSIGESTLGVTAERDLPSFARTTFRQWFMRESWPERGPRVVLFADSFNNFHTPPIAQAAATFLRETGHTVDIPGPRVCCGRTYLSKGAVHDAQVLALKTVETLFPYAEAGVPIVGLEPSCILTLRDEFLSLLPGEPRAKVVAEAAMTFEEYVAQRADEGAFDEVSWSRQADEVMLHGHCHQKALTGTTATEKALSLPGYAVNAIDAGCCGMAGAFGYEAEHVDVSKTMGELRLAPSVRAAAPDTLISATGFSCRHQIDDLTGRAAQHPAEILLDVLDQ